MARRAHPGAAARLEPWPAQGPAGPRPDGPARAAAGARRGWRERAVRAAVRRASAALAACILAGTVTAAGPGAGAASASPMAGMAPAVPGGTTTPTAAAAGAVGMTGAALDGVSCTSPAQCTATGVVVTRRGNTATTLAERWNGRTWAVQPTPTLRSAEQAGGALAAGVSCTSATSCVAAGFSYRHHSLTLLAEGWNGTRWTVQPATAPARPVLAYRISCTSGRDCVTVGLQRSGRILAEHWNGRTWSVQPTGRQGVLLGVSCPASGDCEAVGHTLGGDSLAEHWSGASWTAQPAASPPPGSQLMGVSCRRAGVCMAVGTAGAPFAERWTGRTWSVVPVPDPAPRSGIAELISVSCPSATTCLAVGDYENGAGTTDTTLAARWNGAAWTIKATPSPARFSRLVSVSCTSATWCVAVGAAGASASGPARPLAESWDGTAWAVRVTPR